MPTIDKIIRSKRKTIALVVQRDGKLIVRAPKRATKREINVLVKKYADWIEKKQAQFLAEAESFSPRKFVEGEEFFFLGKIYFLQITGAKKTALRLWGEHFQLAKFAEENAEWHFEKWYKKEARKIFTKRVEFYAEKYDFEYAKLKLSSARTRWGSCSSNGNINLTWRLVMMPQEIIDYVIVHELCHLREQNHSRAFWAQVEAILLDYKKRRKWLKENGRGFHFP